MFSAAEWVFGPICLWPLALAALVLLVFALRGRLVGDHPTCRRCGFDLFGKPAESTVCSECGADLKARRAVRIGRRERRRGLAAFALAMLLGCCGCLGWCGVGIARATDWQKKKPVWWLRREADGGDGPRSRAALEELRSRFEAGLLSDAQTASLAALALDRQVDLSRPWDRWWGFWVQAAEDRGAVPQARWEQYLRRSYSIQFRCRPRVGRGDPLVVLATLVYGRPGEMGPSDEGRLDAIRFAGREVEPVMARTRLTGSLAQISIPSAEFHRDRGFLEHDTLWQYSLDPGGEAGAPCGPQEASVTGHVMLLSQTRFTELRQSASVHWTLLPADESSVTINPAPDLRGAVERALAVNSSFYKERKGFGVEVDSSGPPIALAYDVFVVPDGAGAMEQRIGSVDLPAGVEAHSWAGIDWPGKPPDRVDVILRPSSKRAAETVDLMEIWGGEVVRRGVRVWRY